MSLSLVFWPSLTKVVYAYLDRISLYNKYIWHMYIYIYIYIYIYLLYHDVSWSLLLNVLAVWKSHVARFFFLRFLSNGSAVPPFMDTPSSHILGVAVSPPLQVTVVERPRAVVTQGLSKGAGWGVNLAMVQLLVSEMKWDRNQQYWNKWGLMIF